jgi:hypothetical protein
MLYALFPLHSQIGIAPSFSLQVINIPRSGTIPLAKSTNAWRKKYRRWGKQSRMVIFDIRHKRHLRIDPQKKHAIIFICLDYKNEPLPIGIYTQVFHHPADNKRWINSHSR